jgi:hypothetical protein
MHSFFDSSFACAATFTGARSLPSPFSCDSPRIRVLWKIASDSLTDCWMQFHQRLGQSVGPLSSRHLTLHLERIAFEGGLKNEILHIDHAWWFDDSRSLR